MHSELGLDVISYEGDNKTFVFKHPTTDFNTMSQLIVHESQQAVLMQNGHILQTFGAGRFTMDTQNIPLLRKLAQLPFRGGETPFHCEVYFVNLTEQTNVLWGTAQPVEYVDPEYKMPLHIGANGVLSFRVTDGRKLILNLVGTENGIGREGIMEWFRNFVHVRVSTYLAQYMMQPQISIFTVDQYLLDMADTLKEKIAPDFAQYGFLLEQFLVNGLRKPVGESAYEGLRRIFERRKLDIENARIDQQLSVIDEQALAQRRLIESESLARKRAIEGYSYQEERSFDALEKLADNPGIGDFSNAGIGLGMMAGIGSSIGGHMNQMVNQTLAHTSQEDGSTKSSSTGEETTFCTQCGHKLANDFHFCPKCGNAIGKGAAT